MVLFIESLCRETWGFFDPPSSSTLQKNSYVIFFLNIWLMLCTYSVGVMPKENLKALLNVAVFLKPHLLAISFIEMSECSMSIFAAYSARRELI